MNNKCKNCRACLMFKLKTDIYDTFSMIGAGILGILLAAVICIPFMYAVDVPIFSIIQSY